MIFPDGGAKFSVTIRTAQLIDDELIYWAGGGIVAASDPHKEVAETTLKAQVFLESLS
ncbi:MAG: chorismate-binding protein [Myxococcales bacterium]|nr:MAG: chorismate-binding protein [Myxococcales bacterium]